MSENIKRTLAVVLVLLLTIPMVACGGGGVSNTDSAGSGGAQPAAESNQAEPSKPEPSADAITLSLNHVGAIEHPYHAGALKFAELVEEKTGGTLSIDVFPASQIASGAKAVEFVQMGTLDIALESTMAFGNFVPEVGVLDLPFIFKDKEQAFRILDGEIGDELKAAAEARGFLVLAWWDNGFRNISNSVRPITAPEDLRGLKIRVPESKVFLKTFETLGAVPTPMAVSEVFTAMQLKTVDGQENPGAIFINNKYSEVNPYYSVTQHIYTAEPLIMSTDRFNELSAEHQQAVREAAAEAAAYQRDFSMQAEKQDLDVIMEGGTEVNIVEDMSAFREAVQPVYEAFASEYGEILSKIQAAG